MRIHFTLLVSFFLTLNMNAQKIVWTSESGGDNQNGAIIGYDLQSQQISTLASLGGNPFRSHYLLFDSGVYGEPFNSGGMVKGSDGYYYGIHEFGLGRLTDDLGFFYRLDPLTNDFELLHTFSGNTVVTIGTLTDNYSCFANGLWTPALGLIEGEPGVFYGIAVSGGAHRQGGIWKYDTNGGGYAKVDDFDTLMNGVGRMPNSPLIVGPNGDLFGVLKRSGGYGFGLYNDDGHLYKVNIATQELEYVANLSTAGWAISEPTNQICYNATLNKIFGTKDEFSGGNFGGGVYSYNFNDQTVTNETSILIGSVGVLGSNAYGMPPIANDGNHYFVTKNGGANNTGTLVKYIPGVNTMTKVHDFSYSPNGKGITVSGSKIFGTYFNFGDSNPMMWCYDVSSGIMTDVVMPSSDNSIGKYMSESFIVDGTDIIGRTNWGGDGDAETLFKYSMVSGQTIVIQQNASPEGRGLIGELLVVNDSILYAYTSGGGSLVHDSSAYNEHGGMVKVNLVDGEISSLDSLNHGLFNYAYSNTCGKLRQVITQNGNLFTTRQTRSYSSGIGTVIKKHDVNTGSKSTVIFPSSNQNYLASVVEFQPNKLALANFDSIYVYNDADGSVQAYHPNLDTDLYGNFCNNLLVGSNGRLYGMTKPFQQGSFDDTKK